MSTPEVIDNTALAQSSSSNDDPRKWKLIWGGEECVEDRSDKDLDPDPVSRSLSEKDRSCSLKVLALSESEAEAVEPSADDDRMESVMVGEVCKYGSLKFSSAPVKTVAGGCDSGGSLVLKISFEERRYSVVGR